MGRFAAPTGQWWQCMRRVVSTQTSPPRVWPASVPFTRSSSISVAGEAAVHRVQRAPGLYRPVQAEARYLTGAGSAGAPHHQDVPRHLPSGGSREAPSQLQPWSYSREPSCLIVPPIRSLRPTCPDTGESHCPDLIPDSPASQQHFSTLVTSWRCKRPGWRRGQDGNDDFLFGHQLDNPADESAS